MNKTWVVVADSARARIFELGRSRAELREIEDLIDAGARLKEQELTSDASGRAFDSMGNGRHAMENKTSAKEQESIDFAARLDGQLVAGLNEHRFTDLILIVAPEFLGVLRAKLDDRVMDTVKMQLDKNLTQHSTEDIAAHLPER